MLTTVINECVSLLEHLLYKDHKNSDNKKLTHLKLLSSHLFHLNREKFKAIALQSIIRQVYSLSPYLFNVVLEVVARAIRLKEIKWLQLANE